MDNRKSNLRVCDYSGNNQNRKTMKNNKSGTIGVTWYKTTGKWMAGLKFNSKFKNLGYYDNYDDAVKAREDGEIEYFGEYRNVSKYESV